MRFPLQNQIIILQLAHKLNSAQILFKNLREVLIYQALSRCALSFKTQSPAATVPSLDNNLVCVYVFSCVFSDECENAQQWECVGRLFLNGSSPYILGQGLSLIPELVTLTRVASQFDLQKPCLNFLRAGIVGRVLCFSVSSGNLNSGLIL